MKVYRMRNPTIVFFFKANYIVHTCIYQSPTKFSQRKACAHVLCDWMN